MLKRKFIKKPVVVEAYQTKEQQVIKTLEGDMIASPGDWIVTGIKGEKYPVKPDIFAETYKEV
ncbi:PGDYG domain-containing protein [Priestia megaterium]|uniref:PGDYG domain-containing protein n=1 Tax=Priestia megaterium TaxID=1404 RepID=UPI001F1347E3|nr:PGDYG domain-containing protein [Priestia megaterium]UMZ35592.1 PGDYG domain-containing protein [Priestia megaterium]